MADITEKITLDASQAIAAVERLGKEIDQTEKSLTDLNKTGSSAFSKSASGAKEYEAAVKRADAKVEELEGSLKSVKKAMDLSSGKKQIEQYAGAFGTLKKGIADIKNAVSTGGGAGLAGMIFPPIAAAAAISAVVSAVGEFVSSSVQIAAQAEKTRTSFLTLLKDAETTDKTLKALNTFSNVTPFEPEQVNAAAKSLLAFGTPLEDLIPTLTRVGDIAGATGKDFNELATIYGKARVAGTLYAEDINQLVEAGVPIIQEFAKQLGVSEGEVKKLASEGKIGFAELELAFFNMTTAGGDFAGGMKAQSETLDGLTSTLSGNFKELQKEIGDGLLPLLKTGAIVLNDIIVFVKDNLDVVGEVFRRALPQIGIATKALEFFKSTYRTVFAESIQADAVRETNEAIKTQQIASVTGAITRAKLEESAQKDRFEKGAAAREKDAAKQQKEAEKLAKDLAAAEKEAAKLRIDAMAEGLAKEIAEENYKYSEKKKALEKYNISTEELTKGHLARLLQLELENTIAIRTEAEKAREELEKAQISEEQRRQKFRELQLKEANAGLDIDETKFAIIQEMARKEFFEKRRTAEEIKAFETALGEEQIDFDLKIQRRRLENELQFNAELTAQQRDGIIERLKLLDAQSANQGIENQGFEAKGIYSLLGVQSEDQEKNMGQLLQEAAKVATDAISQVNAARIESARIAKESADAAVETAQTAYEIEAELAKEGFASNLELRRQQYDEAIALQKKAAEDQKKAERAALISDTAIQASNLITASTEIFKVAMKAGPFGLPIAIATIAAMFGSFIFAKTKAFQAVKKARHGAFGRVNSDGITEGASHEEGGIQLEIEGKEFFATNGHRFGVVKKEMTAKHFDLLKAVNNDDREKIAQYALQIANRNAGGMAVMVKGNDDRKTVRELQEANGYLRKISDGKPKIYETANARVIERGTAKTIIRKW